MAKPKNGRPRGMPVTQHRPREVKRSRTGRGAAKPPAPASEKYLEAWKGGVRSAETASRRRCYQRGPLGTATHEEFGPTARIEIRS
jgi:hypothetical protein